MDSIDDGFIQSILRAEENEKNIQLVDYKINRKAVGDGNNVSSEVSRLYVNYEKDGRIIKKTYFMKIPSQSPLYNILKYFGIYDKECHMYTRILPEMDRLAPQEDSLSPKCYVSSDSTVLILEDLRESGYKMINRRSQMDFEHASTALRALAKFHALSVKTNELCPDDMNLVKKDGFYTAANDDIVLQSYSQFLKTVKSIPAVEHLHPKLEQFKSRIWDTILNLVAPRDNAINVLNHGDYWSNNMMFKYENDQIKIKFVDFQLCRWSCPANDLMFMIISSVRFEVFESRSEELLEAYHDAFAYWSRYLRCRETYSMQEFKNDFQRAYVFGLNIMGGVLPLVTKKPTDLNLNKAINEDKKVNVDELSKMYAEEKYLETVTKWILFYEKNGLIPA